MLLKIELEAGSLTTKIAQFPSNHFENLVVCGVETVIVIKMSFCCLTDAAVLKYTIYKPISGVCEKKRNNDGQAGVHKSSPIRSKWMTYWPM